MLTWESPLPWYKQCQTTCILLSISVIHVLLTIRSILGSQHTLAKSFALTKMSHFPWENFVSNLTFSTSQDCEGKAYWNSHFFALNVQRQAGCGMCLCYLQLANIIPYASLPTWWHQTLETKGKALFELSPWSYGTDTVYLFIANSRAVRLFKDVTPTTMYCKTTDVVGKKKQTSQLSTVTMITK